MRADGFLGLTLKVSDFLLQLFESVEVARGDQGDLPVAHNPIHDIQQRGNLRDDANDNNDEEDEDEDGDDDDDGDEDATDDNPIDVIPSD